MKSQFNKLDMKMGKLKQIPMKCRGSLKNSSKTCKSQKKKPRRNKLLGTCGLPKLNQDGTGNLDWECRSVAKCLLGMCEALGLILLSY